MGRGVSRVCVGVSPLDGGGVWASPTSFTILFSVSCASSFCRAVTDLLRSGVGVGGAHKKKRGGESPRLPLVLAPPPE